MATSLTQFSTAGMEGLTKTERVTLLEAQIRRREAELLLMHEANRLAVLTLELEKAGLEEAQGKRQINKFTTVHKEREERAEMKAEWAQDMTVQLEQLQELNASTREESATIKKKNELKLQKDAKKAADAEKRQKDEDRAKAQEAEEAHRQRGAAFGDELKQSQEELRVFLARDRRAKEKKALALKTESQELRELKAQQQEQHVQDIQEFRKEVDILALRDKLEKERQKKSKKVARQHLREKEAVEAERAVRDQEFQERAEQIQAECAPAGALAIREKMEMLMAEKAAETRKRYNAEVAELLKREKECQTEVMRIVEERSKLEANLEQKQKLIQKNQKQIQTLNQRGNEEALKKAKIESQRRLVASDQRAKEVYQERYPDAPVAKGTWVWVNGKHVWKEDTPKGKKPSSSQSHTQYVGPDSLIAALARPQSTPVKKKKPAPSVAVSSPVPQPPPPRVLDPVTLQIVEPPAAVSPPVPAKVQAQEEEHVEEHVEKELPKESDMSPVSEASQEQSGEPDLTSVPQYPDHEEYEKEMTDLTEKARSSLSPEMETLGVEMGTEMECERSMLDGMSDDGSMMSKGSSVDKPASKFDMQTLPAAKAAMSSSADPEPLNVSLPPLAKVIEPVKENIEISTYQPPDTFAEKTPVEDQPNDPLVSQAKQVSSQISESAAIASAKTSVQAPSPSLVVETPSKPTLGAHTVNAIGKNPALLKEAAPAPVTEQEKKSTSFLGKVKKMF
mmetsp:Transcript_7327/g.9908  ORF Transcript_7327/g.9908 Transcript_7327/m.9908 type:complete len:736 (+) Transcript_7327:159-2366(+)|eukprot:CAMPEP_0196578458 /NCGR_PEP_ID=MMETSP1081-20130531/7349_1 /TAXON_ID=36882 /ORGANISM="Pyramimonas amylifera, Strain CCMP720" /LENGTH=735 /DNA_ID=CAMNT_0041897683 /DNA_START=164 /DNA_END=2371 /DNA_ORIENTATION=+